MNLTVKPADKLQGKVVLPASKSYSIRAFIISACGGRSIITNPSDCDDVKVAMNVAKALGARVFARSASSWEVIPPEKRKTVSKINVNESGTVLRFLLPLLSMQKSRCVIEGRGTLKGRPNLFLTQTLRNLGVQINGSGKKESIPITISVGNLKGGKMVIDGSLSSQFISALLITAPQLQETTYLKIIGDRLVSYEYIVMTLSILKKAGIGIEARGKRNYKILGNQRFKGLKNFEIPSDYGLAAFLMAASFLIESDIKLTGNLRGDLIQADGNILPLLIKMGAHFQKTAKYIKIKGPCRLKGGNFSLKDCPDLVPIMTVLALFAEGKTRLYNIAHARVKESDRISDLRKELLKVGADIKETKTELIIIPKKVYKNNVELNPHKDHRLAMAFSVLGLKLGVTIKDIECSSKSYPGFVKDLQSLGATLKRKR